MQDTLNKYIQKLTDLIKKSQDKKLLWEEMQVISQRAFELQDKIMAELDHIIETDADILKIRSAFTAKETIWDLMAKITDQEVKIKEKTHHKETPDERKKRHEEIMKDAHEDHCCCHHHHCCCHHHNEDECCHKEAKKCCKGKKKCQKK